MATTLHGRRVAFLVAPEGIKQTELTEPWRAVEEAGGTPVLVAATTEPVFAFDHQNNGRTFHVDEVTASANVDDYDGLVLAGGGPDSDTLRTVPDAVHLVDKFVSRGRPVAAISASPRTLIEAGLARGRRMTSGPNLADEVRNAGADWVDDAVVVDQGLVTSRTRDDLPAFCDKLVEEIGEGEHTGQGSNT